MDSYDDNLDLGTGFDPAADDASAQSLAPTDEVGTAEDVPEGHVAHTTDQDDYVTEINIDLTGDGVDDAASWENEDGTTVVMLDADGDGHADVGGVYDEQGQLVNTAHPDGDGVMTSDQEITPAAFPAESFAVDAETGEWTSSTDD